MPSLQQHLVQRQQSESHNHHDYENPQRRQLTRKRSPQSFTPVDPPLRSDEVGFGLLQHVAKLVEAVSGIAGIKPVPPVGAGGLKIQFVIRWIQYLMPPLST